MLKQIKTIHYRRKREGKTNYRKRLKILLSEKTRLVVRKSLKHMYAQLVEYNEDGDMVKVSAASEELKKLGWKANTGNIPAAYLVGYLLGKKAQKSKVKQAILDIGLQPSVKGSKVYAVAKGAIDAGISVPVSPEMLPNDHAINGSILAKYAQVLQKDKQRYDRYFSMYLKNGIAPEDVAKNVEAVKKSIEAAYGK